MSIHPIIADLVVASYQDDALRLAARHRKTSEAALLVSRSRIAASVAQGIRNRIGAFRKEAHLPAGTVHVGNRIDCPMPQRADYAD